MLPFTLIFLLSLFINDYKTWLAVIQDTWNWFILWLNAYLHYMLTKKQDCKN